MNTSPPWPSPGTWTVCGAAVIGAEGHLVQVEAKDSGPGQEPIGLTGLPEISVCQTRDRVRAAIVNSGLTWPGGVTVTVRPESLPKHGSGLDLAIAVAVLTAAGAVAAVPERCLFYGELGLDGVAPGPRRGARGARRRPRRLYAGSNPGAERGRGRHGARHDRDPRRIPARRRGLATRRLRSGPIRWART